MKNNKERRQQLWEEIAKVKSRYEAELRPLQDELHSIRYVFTRRQLLDAGFEKTGFYPAAMEDIYTKNGNDTKKVYVYREWGFNEKKHINMGLDEEVRVGYRDDIKLYFFEDMEDLESWFKK